MQISAITICSRLPAKIEPGRRSVRSHCHERTWWMNFVDGQKGCGPLILELAVDHEALKPVLAIHFAASMRQEFMTKIMTTKRIA